jgi:hypothetical protein
MLARSPQEICSLFQRYMAEGNLESVLDLYDPEVARRLRDGTWRWLIGDPFTVGRATSGSRSG